MNTTWPWPGARWWKFDFHCHTPASNDYHDKNITEEDWLRSAMQSGLDCIAVTDHNSGEWIDRLKSCYKKLSEEKPEWFRELLLFPGVEITVSDSAGRVHLLAIFDPSKEQSNITAFLGACGIQSSFGDHQNISTTKGFVETIETIKNFKGVAIPAHIDGEHGLLHDEQSLNPEIGKSLQEIGAAEFCNPDAFSQADRSLQEVIGKLAKLGGSDAHSLQQIGRFSSWVKMSDPPSLEGLRLAIMDHEYCVSNQEDDPNQPPAHFLTDLTIRSMNHCGRPTSQPFKINFHPHFNALIGGRGTGKSTVLESIRIAARREDELAPLRLMTEIENFKKLSEQKGVMLRDTELLLGFHRSSGEFRLRWRFDGKGAVLEENKNFQWIAVEAGNVRERCPLRIYSQKQIYELACNPKGVLDIIDQQPAVDRSAWKMQWDLTVSEFKQMRMQYNDIQRQLLEEENLNVKIGDAERAIKEYEEKGYGEILKQFQKRAQQESVVPLEITFDNLAPEIRQLAEKSELPDFPSHLFDEMDESKDELARIHQECQAATDQIKQEMINLAVRVENLIEERKTKIQGSKWQQLVRTAHEQYQQLVHYYQSQSNSFDLSAYGRWVQHQKQLEKQIAGMNTLKEKKKSIRNKMIELFLNLLKLRKELFDRRREFISSVIGDNRYVRMELVQFGDISSMEMEFRNFLGLTGDTFSNVILDRENKKGLLWNIFTWEENNRSADELPNLVNDMKESFESISKGETSSGQRAFDNKLITLRKNQPANLDNMMCWWPEDMLRVKYARDPNSGKFETLAKGSPGQKAAAILAFLLSHGEEPLIMDQPEDDLDNALIHDLVVKQIRDNKVRRQLIIVTHNPNIVVNGDAELVHILKFVGGQVQLQKSGGIEDQAIRDGVCNIMEGGREAFVKRYRRIMQEH